MPKIYNKIFFDFDSTIVKAETLDILAEMKGIGKEVKKLTEASMNGEVPLERVFKKKVDMICPRQKDIDLVIHKCRDLLVDDIGEVINLFHSLGKQVFILSSNFRKIIEPIGNSLGVPNSRIITNEMYFNDQGQYVGISNESPLCCSGGKAVVIKPYLVPDDVSAFVGDASSDVVCKDVVDLFVGFGGVVARDVVKQQAKFFIENPSMAPLLSIVLNNDELKQINQEEFKDLISKAQKLTTATKTTTCSSDSW